jgi:hypothetical protein
MGTPRDAPERHEELEMSADRQPEQQVAKEPEQSERKAYRAPTLRRLGSVRDLTLGSRAGKPEGAGLRMA